MITNYRDELIGAIKIAKVIADDVRKNNYTREVIEHINEYLHTEVAGHSLKDWKKTKWESFDDLVKKGDTDFIRLDCGDMYFYISKDGIAVNLEDVGLDYYRNVDEAIIKLMEFDGEEFTKKYYPYKDYEEVEEFTYAPYVI